ncbi:ABC transporter permease [Anaerococcus sp. AGMB00486]|uniref:ABC transporter permease n=2 Tax=Anaerococcus TaxID=165779 RepID=A0ABX2NAC8_9FIRM|nr:MULTISPECIES: ABC transporter permease [Anaerococcus]MDY3005677.1 ABC transporter permease [Anaerococcus porci]MSS77753.1 ABC transporter permease [Anaerococcus porci]NVF11608.1 ABC transporter permease [Anaerococcus faecalis]
MAKKYQRLSFIYYIWILIFIVAPILLLLYQSFYDIYGNLTLDNYRAYFSNKNYIIMTLNSFLTAFLITAFTLLWAYPFSYFLTKAKHKDLILLLVILPTWINLVLKAYAFIGLFNKNGSIAGFLGLASEGILFTNPAFILVASYVELPFMILPIFRSIDSIPNEYIIASEDLGANKIQTFRKVILPLSMDGIVAGVQAVFIPSLSLFLITRIIGGNKIITLGTAVEQHYLVTQNWGMGSTIGLVLIFMMFVVISILNRRGVENEK